MGGPNRCINSSNKDEQGHQVQLMGIVYSDARRALLWLGEVSDELLGPYYTLKDASDVWLDSESGLSYNVMKRFLDARCSDTAHFSTLFVSQTFLFLHRMAEDHHLADCIPKNLGRNDTPKTGERDASNDFENKEDLGSNKEAEADKNEDIGNDARRDTTQLGCFTILIFCTGSSLQCDWWHRIWTVQECVLAHSALIIHGPFAMSWQTLLKARIRYDRHYSSCCASFAARIPEPQRLQINEK